jgi:hypothetical protein
MVNEDRRMSLADLVPVILETRMEPRRLAKLTNTDMCRRWRHKHAAKWNAYRSEWRRRKAAEVGNAA